MRIEGFQFKTQINLLIMSTLANKTGTSEVKKEIYLYPNQTKINQTKTNLDLAGNTIEVFSISTEHLLL